MYLSYLNRSNNTKTELNLKPQLSIKTIERRKSGHIPIISQNAESPLKSSKKILRNLGGPNIKDVLIKRITKKSVRIILQDSLPKRSLRNNSINEFSCNPLMNMNDILGLLNKKNQIKPTNNMNSRTINNFIEIKNKNMKKSYNSQRNLLLKPLDKLINSKNSPITKRKYKIIK